MKVTLIDTDTVWAWGSRMLSAVLKQGSHEPRLLLMDSGENRYTPEQFRALDRLVTDSALIGISCHSMGSDKARQVLEHLKPLGILTVWGGIHATLNPEECAEFADLVCVGEGEGMIADLVSRLEQRRDWRDVQNVVYREKDKIVRNPLRPLVSKMDDLPLLDFSCTDEFHLLDKRFVRKTRMSDFAKEEIPFLGSRGCFFHCTYCCNGKLRQTYAGKGYYVRKHSVAQCIERAAVLRQYFPEGKRIFFLDDDFLDRTPEELQEFAENFAKRVNLPFECNVSPLRVNPQRVDSLVKAGVWRIRMGVESGSERTKREVYSRPMPNDSVVRASEVLSRYPNVVRAYYFIIGNPFEEREDLLETIRLILRLPYPYFIQVFNLIFFPGSVLYERAVSAGFISGKQDSGYDLNFRAGLRYEGHSWKKKNLYLNALLFMMEGKVTKRRLGTLPRFLVPWLIDPRVVALNERHLAFARSMVAFKRLMLALRSRIASILKRVLSNKEPLYNPGSFVKTRMQRLFGSAGS